VLGVGEGRRDCRDHGRVERPAARREEEHGRRPARELEAAGGEVVVRHAVAQEMRERPECGRPGRGPCQGAHESAGRDVKGDDHPQRRRGGDGERGAHMARRIFAGPTSKIR
jgi:hypothetical protein